jgi:hypothetical protein
MALCVTTIYTNIYSKSIYTTALLCFPKILTYMNPDLMFLWQMIQVISRDVGFFFSEALGVILAPRGEL